jgi:hypothetical protein
MFVCKSIFHLDLKENCELDMKLLRVAILLILIAFIVLICRAYIHDNTIAVVFFVVSILFQLFALGLSYIRIFERYQFILWILMLLPIGVLLYEVFAFKSQY